MTDRRLAGLLQFLRREAGPPDLVSDGELLSRYVASRDEAAFELLVRRHGPLVFGTARRVLRDEHAAEDVFQATFLALARKANSLRHRDAVAGWLHQVALRAALRSRPKSMLAPCGYIDNASKDAELTELRAVLDEEVARLPERQRLAVVLCYLGGKTAEEAAWQLGCPRGTLLSRLAAARDRLQRRLTRRGYGLPAAGLAALWAGESAPAISSHLIALTLRTAGPAVVRLTEGVLHAMVMTKLKAVTAVVLLTGAVGIGVGAWADGSGDGKAAPNATAAKMIATEKRIDDKLNDAIAPARQADLRAKLVNTYRAALVQSHNQRFEDQEKLEVLRESVRDARQRFELYDGEERRFETELIRNRLQLKTKARMLQKDMIKADAIAFLEVEVEIASDVLQDLQKLRDHHSLELKQSERDLRQFINEVALREKLAELDLEEIRRQLK